ncbi:MAG: hypothetical protein D6730_16580 [Bacteroidetes bacterium]|nr:MAG: hypothetical protein D6730_16580 [Bacteroidota bacterium]
MRTWDFGLRVTSYEFRVTSFEFLVVWVGFGKCTVELALYRAFCVLVSQQKKWFMAHAHFFTPGTKKPGCQLPG